MDNKYKIILSNNIFYKEIELGNNIEQLKVGTNIKCDVRLRKEFFHEQFELLFKRNESGFSVYCSDNLYLTFGDARKLIVKDLKHGDSLEVKYQESDYFGFKLNFLIDFDENNKKFKRYIDISKAAAISFGSGKLNNIVLKSEYTMNDAINLVRKNSEYILDIRQTVYGVYVDGKKAKTGDIVKNGDFISIADFSFYLKNNILLTEIRDDFEINSLTYTDKNILDEYPKFNRSTRLKTVVCDEKIEILDPPDKPQKAKNNIVMRLLPSLGMMIASGIMACYGGKMMAMSAVSGVMAIFTTIVSIRENNKDYKKSTAERIAKYNEYAEKKKQEIEHCRKQEHKELEELYISQNIEKKRLEEFAYELFDRTKEDEDYLCVRLGSGDVESKRKIDYKKRERLEVDDELQQIPERLCNEYKNVHNAPIVCDLKKINAMGVVGKSEFRFIFLKNIVIDLVARQYCSDVKMVFVADNSNKDKILWLRFLPQVYNDIIGARNIVCDDESKNLIYEYLYKELTIREQNKKFEEDIIVFFYDECGFKNHPISRFVDKAKELGVTFIFFGNSIADIPQGCAYISSIIDAENAVFINAQNKEESIRFNYPSISNETAEEIVTLLAPVYTEEISLEGTLTKNISMFELLNILSVDDIDLKSRWNKSQVFKSMAAPIGVSKTGIVMLDLHDKAHGPHGLVAGTTGSGKSEILQTYILAMTTLFHPYEVAFVIIDFKGGGMVNQFKNLPHLLGAITNIDGKEINRSLKSIKAELQKRQRLFAEADVNHIDKYIKKYKAGEVSIPLPHLIIIVDEFAELKAEQPEFMKELISAARIGRSLGVHLILATQKPSGQVNEQIWSNSRFKLCLKVQSQQDSNEVIKSPLAAEIKEPGRAYLQVGNNEIFELFQSAYSGAPEKMDASDVKEFAIYKITESNKRVPIFVQKKKKGEEGNLTQLDAIVKYVTDYCDDIKLTKLQNICLPPLQSQLPFVSDDGVNGFSVRIGIYDDPDAQFQGGTYIDLAEKNLIIIGSSQTGKTNLLQVLIRSLASHFSPAEINIYMADFGTMILKNFEELNHVGGVVCAGEGEKLKNMFKMLNEEISVRKEKLLSAGVSSFVAYCEAGKTDMPLIVLIIDNIGLLKELYFTDNDWLLPICKEGLAVGISVVATNSQTSGIGYRYLANFDSKIAFYCNDATDYSMLFGNSKVHPDNIAGRCVIEINKELYESQIFLAFAGEKEYQRVEKINDFINEINSKSIQRAKRIPLIPDVLTEEYLLKIAEEKEYSCCIGLQYENICPKYIDFANTVTLGIVAQNGKELQAVLKHIVSTVSKYPLELYLMDNFDSALKDYEKLPQTQSYSRVADQYYENIAEIYTKVRARYEYIATGADVEIKDEPLIMIAAHGQDFVDAISADRGVLDQFKQIVTKYKRMKVCFVLSGIENVHIPVMGADVLKIIKENNNFIILDDIRNIKVVDISPVIAKKYRENRGEYDAYAFIDNDLQKIKLPRIIC